jgi:hypothetical protein
VLNRDWIEGLPEVMGQAVEASPGLGYGAVGPVIWVLRQVWSTSYSRRSIPAGWLRGGGLRVTASERKESAVATAAIPRSRAKVLS